MTEVAARSPGSSRGRPTMAVVAAAAGVSLPTVSKVVNGRADVAPQTRQRVLRVLAEHGYVPVGSRRLHRSGHIDLVFTWLDSPWAVEILRGVEQVGHEQGIGVVVSAMRHGGEEPRWVDDVIARGRDGALVVTSRVTAEDRERLAAVGVPLVVIDPVDIPDPDVPSVGATNWAGGLAATQHLVGIGHRRIAVISGPPHFLCSRARIDGYRAGLEQAGISVDAELVRHGDFRHEGAYREAMTLLALPDPPTAIFAGSDQQALAVYEAARVTGRRVPTDLSVVGFDDLPVARWLSPPLTTVRQPLTEMGVLAARMLLQLVAGQSLDTSRLELATQLVVRESTAPRG